jgi:hypothetical protein
MKNLKAFNTAAFLFLAALLLFPRILWAGVGTGTGPDVSVSDNGETVTLANGIASIVIVKKTGRLNSIAYLTFNHDPPGCTLIGPNMKLSLRAPPFVFTQSNASSFSQRFYRTLKP